MWSADEGRDQQSYLTHETKASGTNGDRQGYSSIFPVLSWPQTRFIGNHTRLIDAQIAEWKWLPHTHVTTLWQTILDWHPGKSRLTTGQNYDDRALVPLTKRAGEYCGPKIKSCPSVICIDEARGIMILPLIKCWKKAWQQRENIYSSHHSTAWLRWRNVP